MRSTATTNDFVSIGQLAAHVQHSVRSIERAAERLHLVPSMRLNGVPYWDGPQVERLTEALRETSR
jgi:hypothetical protein